MTRTLSKASRLFELIDFCLSGILANILFVKIDPRHMNIQWPFTQSSWIFVKKLALDCCTITNLNEIIHNSL